MTRVRPYPFVMFCRNDPRNGNPIDRLWALSVTDLCELEGFADGIPFAYDEADLVVTISGQRFPLESRLARWVGNWCWDGAAMAPDVLAKLLVHLRDGEEWACCEAITPLMEQWDRETHVTADEFLEVIRG